MKGNWKRHKDALDSITNLLRLSAESSAVMANLGVEDLVRLAQEIESAIEQRCQEAIDDCLNDYDEK